MPTDLAGLCDLGRRWKRRFAEIRILGQIELSREETARYWRALSRMYFSRGPEAFRKDVVDDLDCVTAVVLANLAFYSDLEETGEGQQRGRRWVEHFTRDLHWGEVDRQRLWEDRIGSRVRRVVVTHLGYEEDERDSGSFRFVRPAVRQAGVPLGQIDQFLDWVRPLARMGHLTKTSYHRHIERAGVPGSILAWFLRTEDGFEFCSGLIRGLAEEDTESIPGIRPEILERARKSLRVRRRRRAEVAREAMPRFCFDAGRLELGIDLPEGGRVQYYLDNYRIFGFLPLKTSGVHSGDVVRLDRRGGGTSEPLSVSLKGFGGKAFWAAFSVAGGRYLAGSSSPAAIPAGQSVVVATTEAIDELGASVAERLGEVELPPWAPERLEAAICIFKNPCRLSGVYPQGTIPVTVPTLSIESGGCPFKDVYLDLPTIRVVGWGKERARDYRAFWKADTGPEPASPTQAVPIDDEGRLALPARPDRTARIRVWLEPTGFAPRGWDEQAAVVEFALLAPGSILSWPIDLFAFDEPGKFRLSGPDIASVSLDGRQFGVSADGTRELPLRSGYVEFTLTTSAGLTVSLPVRMPRVSLLALVGGFREWPVLFQDELARDVELRIAMPVERLPEHVGVGLLKRRKVCGTTELPVRREARRTGALHVGGRSLSDALGESPCSTGPLVLVSDGKALRLGACYAKDPLALIRWATSENREVLQSHLGADKTELLERLSAIAQRSVRVPSDAGRGRSPLEETFAELRYMSEVLDFDDPPPEAPSHKPVLASLQKAAETASGRMHGTGVDAAQKDLEALVEDYGWVPRWRVQIEEFKTRLGQVIDSTVAIREWGACISSARGDPARIRASLIHRRPGGTALTEGARKVVAARRSRRPIGFLGGEDGAFEHLRRAEEQAGRGSLLSFISKVLVADAYRAAGDRPKAQALDRHTMEEAPEHWQNIGQEVRTALGLSEEEH